jgi:hypothetical protein
MEYDKTLYCLRQGPSQTERRPRMAAFAVVKVGLAESAAAVVASHAGLRARRREVLHRQSGCDLATLLESTRAHCMATFAA